MEEILRVRDLEVTYAGVKDVPALQGVNLSVRKGEILGIIGESGSGKSTLAFSLLNLLPPDVKKEGDIIFKGRSVMALREKQWQDLRGSQISMVFQDAAASFNPVLSIGYQFQEILEKKGRINNRNNREKIISDTFTRVRLTDCRRIINSYPHQLSGGQLQRVSIAMAIWQNPDILIADEPTSSLDVTIESQIINLFKELRDAYRLTIIFITHNFDLVKALCERVVVLYQGKVREISSGEALFRSPKDAYTMSLLEAFRELEE